MGNWKPFRNSNQSWEITIEDTTVVEALGVVKIPKLQRIKKKKKRKNLRTQTFKEKNLEK